MKIKYQECEVLVIGSGGAGLRTAIELKDNKKDVLVVGKCKIRDAHTIMAKGGINASLGNMDSEDNWKIHAADTIRDGGMINDTDAVEILCKNATNSIKELDKWGVKFHKENKKIVQRFFGAATFRRACFVGDQTGKAILNTLVNQTMKRNIRILNQVYIFKLLENKGIVNGAIGIDFNKGNLICISAKIVILATGGHSRVFSRSSSWQWENSGDGIKLAYDLGASFMDMEMFQFHPTGMVYPKSREGYLVTEAVRGEGGILTNSNGERFMQKYDSERMELSARDVVSRANYNEIASGRGTKRGGVYLDISSKGKSYIKKRLPDIFYQFRKYNKIDISKQKMEVAPTAHYSMGGIYVTHKTGMTDVKNLFAVGEVTAGLHGGNRLGGNSLAEIVVFGRLVGDFVSKRVRKIKNTDINCDESVEWLKSFMKSKGLNPKKKKQEFQFNMWEHVGVVRDRKNMIKGLKNIDKFRNMKFKTGTSLKKNENLMNAFDIENMIPTSEMIIRSALDRKESRASHYRKDYPKINSKWKKNIICKPFNKGLKIIYKSVKPVRKDIKGYVENKIRFKKERHMSE